MTKKDYIAVAKIIAQVRSDKEQNYLMDAFAAYFKSDNSAFDKPKFFAFVLTEKKKPPKWWEK